MKRYWIYIIIGIVVIFGVWQTVAIVSQDANKQNQNTTVEIVALQDIGTVPSLTILPLYELKASSPQYQTGAGVSYMITAGDKTILMDTGDNLTEADPSELEQNMKVAGVTADQFDAIVISHMHPDHIGGKDNWFNKTFSIGKNTSIPNSLPIYLPESINLEGDRGKVVSNPTILAPGIVSLGAITFNNPFPISFMRPTSAEQSLAIKVDGVGVVLITGCGHPGLPTLITRAETVMGEPVVGIIGGLHYKDKKVADLGFDSQLMKDRGLMILAISPHDTATGTIEYFREQFPDAYIDISVGQPIVVSP